MQNAILRVTAVDKGTGNINSITITNDKGRLTPEEIEHMVAEAEKFAEDDKKLKERIEARNGLENYAHSLKNQLKDEQQLGGKLSNEEKEEIGEAVRETLSWIDGNASATAEDFSDKKRKLEEIVQPIMAKLYSGSGGPSGPSGDEEMPYHDDL